MKTITLIRAYNAAYKRVYLAQSQEELENAVRKTDTLYNVLLHRLAMLERPETQCCPQCEEKAKKIEYLEERLKAKDNLNAELCTKVVDLHDIIVKQRHIQRARDALRIAELESQLHAYCAWGAAAHVLVDEMVNMLTHEQVGRINGLRSWQETEPIVPQYVAMWDNKESHHE